MVTVRFYLLVVTLATLALSVILTPRRFWAKDCLIVIRIISWVVAGIATMVLIVLIWLTNKNTYLAGKIFVLIGIVLFAVEVQLVILNELRRMRIALLSCVVSCMVIGLYSFGVSFISETLAPASGYERTIEYQIILAELPNVLGDEYDPGTYVVSLGGVYMFYAVGDEEAKPIYAMSQNTFLQSQDSDGARYTMYLVRPYQVIWRENKEIHRYIDEPYQYAILEVPTGSHAIVHSPATQEQKQESHTHWA